MREELDVFDQAAAAAELTRVFGDSKVGDLEAAILARREQLRAERERERREAQAQQQVLGWEILPIGLKASHRDGLNHGTLAILQ